MCVCVRVCVRVCVVVCVRACVCVCVCVCVWWGGADLVAAPPLTLSCIHVAYGFHCFVQAVQVRNYNVQSNV